MNRRATSSAAQSAILGAAALALALALPAAALAAPKENDKEKPRDAKAGERKVVAVQVIDDGSGKPKVYQFDGKPVPRPFLGVGLTDLTPELRTHFGVPDDAGVMVSHVDPGSPAEKAGLKVGDIVTSLDGEAIQTSWELQVKVRKTEEGDQVPIEVWRNGKVQTLTATIEKRERPALDLAPFFKYRKDGDKLTLLGDGGLGDRRIELPLDQVFEQGGPPGAGLRVLRLNAAREEELEKQLKALEKRIQELEKQLQKK